jgi:hypothetical protein
MLEPSTAVTYTQVDSPSSVLIFINFCLLPALSCRRSPTEQRDLLSGHRNSYQPSQCLLQSLVVTLARSLPPLHPPYQPAPVFIRLKMPVRPGSRSCKIHKQTLVYPLSTIARNNTFIRLESVHLDTTTPAKYLLELRMVLRDQQ